MSTVVEIRSGGGEQGLRRVHLDGSVQIGRAPENDLVLQDAEVSWRHALIYEDAGAVWVRDLGSRNGTEVDGERITGPTRLSDRSRLRIGSVELGVLHDAPRLVPLLLEVSGTGVRHPLTQERYIIGPHDGANLQHSALESHITILLPGNGEVWVGHDGDDQPIELGQAINIQGFAFSVLEADPHRVPTVEATGSPYAYTLTASLEGGPGPVATLCDPDTDATCRFTAETRATLLYTLGRQSQEDQTAGQPATHRGWVADPDLITAVWGRTPLSDGLARLKTLIHRVRADCRECGLDPWCVEKRRGHSRIRVASITLS